MAVVGTSFEGGTVAAVSTTNPPTSGSDTAFPSAPNITGTAALNIINTDSMHGTKCMESSQSDATSSGGFGRYTGLSGTTMAVRYYFKFTTVSPGSAITFFRAFDNVARCLSVQLSAANKILVQVSSTDTLLYTSTATIAANTWYRLEIGFTLSSSANATVTAQLYSGDSTTPLDSGLSTTTATTTSTGTSIADVRFGRTGSTVTNVVRYDDVAYNLGTTTFIGPYLTPPTASFTHSEAGATTYVDGSGSTAAGAATITGYDWDWGDGSTHGTGVTASHAYSSSSTYTVVLTVTDSNSQTGNTSQSVTVTFTPSGGVSPVSVDVATGWTPTGGTNLAVITDTDGSTYTTSVAGPSAQEFDVTLGALTAPSSGNPLKVFLAMRARGASSASLAAQLYEGATLRSSLTGVTIPINTGLPITSTVTLTFPWSDVQNVVTWTGLKLKIQVTAA